jgi:putative transposase
MQPRKRKKWTTRLRKWVVLQALKGITPIAEIARNRGVSRRSIYMLLDRYKRYGINGLDPKPRGRKKEPINKKFEELVIANWQKRPIGVHKMWIELKRFGFSVSERKIQRIYKKSGLKMNRRKRPTQIKFVKYEWPKSNMLWHTDWTTCPYTKKQLIAFIDDYSRFIVHAELFDKATTENTLIAFEKAIKKYGKPENILTDNGTQFTPARGEKGPFTKWCEKQGIKHILGRVHHPQTNGKIERWFGTYKSIEYKEGEDDLKSFVDYYNNNRLHQGINYKVPRSRYLSVQSN